MVEPDECLWSIDFRFCLKRKRRSLKVEAWDIRSGDHGSKMWLWENGNLFHPGGDYYDPPFLEE